MTLMLTRIAALGVALAATLAPALGHADDGVAPVVRAARGVHERDVVEIAPAHKPIRAISIDNELGSIRIEGHAGPGIVIHAYKRAPDEAALDRLRVSLVPEVDGAVRIVTAFDPGREARPVAARSARIDLVIRAPHSARITARVLDGHLEIANLDAGAELDAGAGDIDVDNVAGGVVTRTIQGDQHFSTVFGAVDALAIDADVSLDNVRGDHLVASVHDGRIDGRRVRSRRVELRTTHGDITLESDLIVGGQLVVASLDGNVAVRLHGGIAVAIQARSRGVIELPAGAPLDREGDAVRAQYGRGRAVGVELRSRYGDVRVALVAPSR